jgi:PKD repeat protein
MYKDKGKKVKHGKETISEFWATHIPGDTAIVRLYSKKKKGGWGFVIDKWARGYERGHIEAVLQEIEDDVARIQAICGEDDKEWAKCYEGTEMYNKARAVCRLLINGTNACTGWLLGSQGHVMTNNHCIDTQDKASNTDYEFMAEGETCSTNCASWMACEGTLVVQDGTLIRNDSALDYSLILLAENVTPLYGYLQFRDELPAIDERIYIPQHPGAWGKQLAVWSDVDGGYCDIYSTNEPPCSGGPGDIGYYADTEGGSSGSPVLGYNDHCVVALHHCANCPNRGVPTPSIIADLGSNIPTDAICDECGSAPVADFSVTPTTVCLGGAVNLTDLSSNCPTSWSWTFECGTPSTSTAQNPTVIYNSLGRCNITLVVTNEFGSDSETKTITVVECCQESCTYCESSGNSQQYEWIARVQVDGGIDNSSGPSPYSDFTVIKGIRMRGGNANVSLTPGYAGTEYEEHWKIWIDYNRDCNFDESELVFDDKGISLVSGSFIDTVPEDACLGNTRMRVSMKYGSWPIPCEAFSYGEVEDYTVKIMDPPQHWPCTGTETVGHTTVFSLSTTTANRRAMPFTMPENCEIFSVTMYHTGGSGSMILGVYDGESLPANRLGVTATTAVSGSTGWQTIDLTNPAYVMGGTTVWLAWVYESNPGIRYETGAPGRADAGVGWSGGMPDPFGSGSQANYLYSIYATYGEY